MDKSKNQFAKVHGSEDENSPCCMNLDDLLGITPCPEDTDLLINEPPLVRFNDADVVLVLESCTKDIKARGLNKSTAIVVYQHRRAGGLWTNRFATFQCCGCMYLSIRHQAEALSPRLNQGCMNVFPVMVELLWSHVWMAPQEGYAADDFVGPLVGHWSGHRGDIVSYACNKGQ